MNRLLPDWPGLPENVRAFTTLRTGGCSTAPYDDGKGGGGFNVGQHVGDDPESVTRNRHVLRTMLPAEPLWLAQVHGNRVARTEDFKEAVAPPQADACITAEANQVCAIMTADCLPVLFSDAEGRVVGAAHAGWRGLLDGVLQATVEAMRSEGARHISAWMGPAIGPDAFEVGDEVRQRFAERYPQALSCFLPKPEAEGKYMADLYALARLVLASAGIERVHGGDCCTVTDAARFYSYRRDGRTGRMVSVIWRQ